ncbi:MAG TPA: AAA family ATPase, partial [Acetobacteraceae bacterium]|nr:AAA family ATPase [Acetobacteraceae bacterium]
MRLTGLTLCRYGIFDAQRIAFDPKPGCINLLVAPNGAGKSIIRQAFCDLLFGIHGQTPMGFRFGYNGMKLAAEAIGPDGAAFSFGRRKGQGNTLIGADGTPLGGAEVARLLGRTDLARLELLFALDTERLRSGGRDLLASDGAVADALLSAAGGLRQARQLRQSLEVQRDSLAPTRKSAARPFYAGLDRFVGAGRRLRAATVKPEARETQETELRHLEAEQAQLNKLAAQASGRIARLERIRRVVGPLRAHDDAASWLHDHPAAPILPPEIRRRLTAARTALFNAAQLAERETRARQALSEQVGNLVVDDALIDQAEAIERLNDRAGAARQAAGDIPTVGARHAVAAQRIVGLLGQLGLSLPVERAGEAIPQQAAVTRARKLFTRHTTLHDNLERLPGEIAKADADIAETEAALQRLPALQDTGDLQRMIGDIRTDGEPRQRARQSDHAVIERRANLQAALARAPGWTQGAEALVALSPLSANAYGRLDKARTEAKKVLDKAADALAGLQRAAAEDEQQLKQIAAGAPIPDNAALAVARETRDAGWRLIFRRAFTPEPPTLAQEQAWAGEVPVPLAYERSVTAADDVADRRNQDAERLAQVAQLRLRIDNAATEIAKVDADCTAAERAHDAACAAWKQACEPLGFSVPPEPGDVIELLSAREHVIEAQRELTVAETGQSTLQSLHCEWRARLSAALGRGDGAPAELSDLLQRADDVIAAAHDAAVKRTALQSTLASQRKTRDAKLIEQGNATQRLQQFETGWAGARRDLRRPEGEDPDTTIALLDLMGELDKEHRAAIDLGGRLRAMHDALAAFR